MKRSRIWLATVLIMIVLSVSSFSCGRRGGSAKVESTTRTTTLGQELQDLDAAYQKGIITEEEYEKKKKELLKRKE
jgi:uncharacterized membrane protein